MTHINKEDNSEEAKGNTLISHNALLIKELGHPLTEYN